MNRDIPHPLRDMLFPRLCDTSDKVSKCDEDEGEVEDLIVLLIVIAINRKNRGKDFQFFFRILNEKKKI